MNKRSDLLNDLYTLREKLDKNNSNTPDYHINYDKKITKQDYNKKDKRTKEIDMENVRNEIRSLFSAGLTLPRSSKVYTLKGKEISKTNLSYESMRFSNLKILASNLSERLIYERGKDIIFVVNEELSSIYFPIYFPSNGRKEIRFIVK